MIVGDADQVWPVVGGAAEEDTLNPIRKQRSRWTVRRASQEHDGARRRIFVNRPAAFRGLCKSADGPIYPHSTRRSFATI